MTRRRWLACILLALIVVAGGEGYRLAQHDSNPVLSTTALGGGAFNAVIDAWTSRLYVEAMGLGFYILDTRTGAFEHPTDNAANQTGGPVNSLKPQLVTGTSDGQTMLIVDDRTLKLQYKVAVKSGDGTWFLDDRTDTFYVIYADGTINIIDVATGKVLARAPGCAPASANPVESHPDNHLFLPCADGSTKMYNARTGRLLRTIPSVNIGDCTCRRLADDVTGRVFLPGVNALVVVDARTGAIIRTLPIQTWDGGSYEFDAHMGAVMDVDPRSGNVVVAPYTRPGSGPAEREVLVLDGRTGAIVHRWPVPEIPLAVLVNPLTRHLLVASAGPVDTATDPLGDGTLSVLDMASGAILQQIRVGILPGELFADQHAKRLAVMNRTTALDGLPLVRSYPDGAWPQTERSLKHTFGWLPFSAPDAPPPPVRITVSMLNLTKL